MPTLYIASDHAGMEFKQTLQALLPNAKWKDLGPYDAKSVDYPDYAAKVCEAVQKDPQALGILICGSGIGMSIAANKHRGIRAALVENPISAKLSREHNSANVLCLGARFLAPEYAFEIVQAWLNTPPASGERHLQRLAKISQLEAAQKTKP